MRHSSSRTILLGLSMMTAASGFASSAQADPVQELKVEIDALRKKLAELEQKQLAPSVPPQGVATPANVVTGGATKGSFRLPGSETSVTLGGYIKLDGVYSSRSNGVGTTGDQLLEAVSIPVGPNAGANERGQLKLHARQTRLFAKTSTPSEWGELGTYVEFDLFGAAGNESVSNSHGLRVRHAFGSLGGLLVGQTWTTFSEPAAYPETVDFGGSVGVIFARQPQVRWTQAFKGGQWSLALENPETIAALPDGTAFRADDDRFPDMAANIKFDTKRGKYTFAAIARHLRVDSAADPASRDQRWGGGVGVNGVIPAIGDDDFRFSGYYGNAIGRYTTGFFSDAVADRNARIGVPNEWTATAAYRHFWSAKLRSTLAISALSASNPAGTAGTVNKRADSAHLNLIWSPIAQTNFGLEYIHARRGIENGQSGQLNRVQASAQYFF